MGSPEYPDDSIDLQPPSTNSLPMHGMDENNSDSDDIDLDNDRIPSIDPYAGYQQLNLEDLADDNDDDDEDEDNTNVQEPVVANQNPTADAEIACQVWNAPRPNELDIKIDPTKCDEIRSVMSKVTLGGVEPPEWAKNIPETKWIEELLQEVRRKSHSISSISQPDPSEGPSSASK
ncbi:uncharacterized protein LOC119075618 [Bradysia coprophila]|uniref:uncharacterized protein LOC119075618 n=1 Tax=Bradysia coprophila TaxID=38358 RepID=UPI00187D7124|nr:uncharacterized protein LOC119075618 [Bradysia coprophila]